MSSKDLRWIEKLRSPMTQVMPGVFEVQPVELTGRDYFRRYADFLNPQDAQEDPYAETEETVGTYKP